MYMLRIPTLIKIKPYGYVTKHIASYSSLYLARHMSEMLSVVDNVRSKKVKEVSLPTIYSFYPACA